MMAAAFVRDLRFAVRRLGRSPTFTAACLLELVLGIGATVTLFTVLYGVVLRPLPYPQSDRLVVIEHALPGFDMQGDGVRFGALQGQEPFYRDRSRALTEVGVYATADAAITRVGDPEYLRTGYASAGFFRVLSLDALHGRLLDGSESPGDGGARGASLISSALWSRRFGGDPGAVGELIPVDGYDFEVVGVLPSELGFPATDVYIWRARPDETMRLHPDWLVDGLVARLAEGETPETARAELDRLIASLPEAFPSDFVRRLTDEGAMRTVVTPLRDWVVADVSGTLWLVFAASALVLLIALANVANLLLVRTHRARAEIAVRRALGARRLDLLRFHATEATLLSAGAGALGATIGAFGVPGLIALAPVELPRAHDVTFGGASFVAAIAATAVSALLLTVVPLLVRTDHGSLRAAGSTRISGDRSWTTGTLVAGGELALAVVLMLGAALIGQSFLALSRVDPGFEPGDLLSFRIPFPLQEVQAVGRAGGTATPFYERLAERLAALPGVTSVGYAKCLPLADGCGLEGLSLRPEGRVGAGDTAFSGVLQVGPGYQETLRLPLLAGRALTRRDHETRSNAVVISASLAGRLWPDGDALGQRLVPEELPTWTPFTVVGVTGDVRYAGLRGEPEPLLYAPVLLAEQDLELWVTSWILRTEVPPLGLVESVRATVARLRQDVPIADVRTMEDRVHGSTARLRLAAWILALAALVSLALGAVGVYGVVAYAVGARRREFGVRMALGADAHRLRRLVLRQGASLAAIGVVAGLLVALIVGRLLRSLLFEIEVADPVTSVAVIVVLAATAVVASWVPAHRAARLDPADVLRTE